MRSVKWPLYDEAIQSTLFDFLESKQDLEYHLAHELNTMSADVSENVELKDAFIYIFCSI